MGWLDLFKLSSEVRTRDSKWEDGWETCRSWLSRS